MLYEVPSSKVKTLENHQPTPKADTLKFLQDRNVREEQQVSASTTFTGRRFRGSQDETCANPERFYGRTYLLSRDCNPYQSAIDIVSQSQAAISLKHKEIVGVTAVGRQGIGVNKTLLWRSDHKQRQVMIQSKVRRVEERPRYAKAVEIGSQGIWTMWHTNVTFFLLLSSVYDLFPSPANFCLGGRTSDP